MDIGLAILMGIAVLLIMIYLSTRSIVEVLNHWGSVIDNNQNKIINKDFTVDQIDKYLGEYIKDRAIKRGHTTSTVVKRGDNWKVTITYSK